MADKIVQIADIVAVDMNASKKSKEGKLHTGVCIVYKVPDKDGNMAIKDKFVYSAYLEKATDLKSQLATLKPGEHVGLILQGSEYQGKTIYNNVVGVSRNPEADKASYAAANAAAAGGTVGTGAVARTFIGGDERQGSIEAQAAMKAAVELVAAGKVELAKVGDTAARLKEIIDSLKGTTTVKTTDVPTSDTGNPVV